MPLPDRFLTSLAVRLRGQLYIFDAGKGFQIILKKAQWGIRSLRIMAVSHLHGDHCLGIRQKTVFTLDMKSDKG